MVQDPGFSLHFVFDENEFLAVDEIALYCYTTGEVRPPTGRAPCSAPNHHSKPSTLASQVAEVDAPEWQDGCDPTVKVTTKKIKRKGARVAEKVPSWCPW